MDDRRSQSSDIGPSDGYGQIGNRSKKALFEIAFGDASSTFVRKGPSREGIIKIGRVAEVVWPPILRSVHCVTPFRSTLVIAAIVGLGGWLGCDGVLGPEGRPVTSWSVSQAPSWPLNDVWGASSSDVFAVGDRGTILHYDVPQMPVRLAATPLVTVLHLVPS